MPFVNGQNGATTINSYIGSVSLNVSGFGQAAATAYSDAFYVFTNNSGNPIPPEHHPWEIFVKSLVYGSDNFSKYILFLLYKKGFLIFLSFV